MVGASGRALTEPFAAGSPAGVYASGTESASTTTGAGTALPPDSTVTVGLVTSVTDWLPLEVPPGTYSETVPVTVTESPTATFGAELVKTNTPSLVAGFASGAGSWTQKPLDEPYVRTPVTMPGTSVTFWPAYGDIRVVPWMSWMRTESACAGEVRATVEAALQTAATVSAARRAEDLLGNGDPSGDVRGAGTTVELDTWHGGADDARRRRWGWRPGDPGVAPVVPESRDPCTPATGWPRNPVNSRPPTSTRVNLLLGQATCQGFGHVRGTTGR